MNLTDFLTAARNTIGDVPLVVLVLGVTFAFAPTLLLNLGVLVYPEDHDRRRELPGELEAIPFSKRPFWVLSMLALFITEGIPVRVQSIRAARHEQDEAPNVQEDQSADDAIDHDTEDDATDHDSLRRIDAQRERLLSPPNSAKIPPALLKNPKATSKDDPDVGAQPTPTKTKGRFADTDWFTPVEAGAATSTGILDVDFRAWRSEFPDFYDLPDAAESLYSSALAITDEDVRIALGPQADELMAAADVNVDELIQLINAETTVLPIIPNEPSSGWLRAHGIHDERPRRRGRHRKR